MSRRFILIVVVSLSLCPLFARPPETKNEQYKGKVLPLAALLDNQGIKLDLDAAPHWLALVTDDGKTYPLIKDDGSRMFFKDERLQKRPMQLTGRLLNGNLLQVVNVHSIVKGELNDVYYWCDICAIRRNEKKVCDCCGGPMELKEEPIKK
jgi:hypothetical protein